MTQVPTPDYYDLLEVPAGAPSSVIRQHYLLMLQAWHPDKFRDGSQKETATEKSKLFNQAYAVLSDPTKRQEYDRRRMAGPHSNSARQSAKERRGADAASPGSVVAIMLPIDRGFAATSMWCFLGSFGDRGWEQGDSWKLLVKRGEQPPLKRSAFQRITYPATDGAFLLAVASAADSIELGAEVAFSRIPPPPPDATSSEVTFEVTVFTTGEVNVAVSTRGFDLPVQSRGLETDAVQAERTRRSREHEAAMLRDQRTRRAKDVRSTLRTFLLVGLLGVLPTHAFFELAEWMAWGQLGVVAAAIVALPVGLFMTLLVLASSPSQVPRFRALVAVLLVTPLVLVATEIWFRW